ncbi:MAG: phage tail tube protein, partial [Lachnospiraceae bacterium]|nr:phage tail tube protein [Lachnospiraceae bacterium]
NYTADQVINGVDGECWIDGAKMAEVSEFEAVIKMVYTDIPLAHKLQKGKKLTGEEHTGKLHLFHVSDVIAAKVVQMLKQRKCPIFTVNGKVADPDSLGTTRVSLYDVKLDEVPLLKWERTNVGEFDINFTFGDYDYEPIT